MHTVAGRVHGALAPPSEIAAAAQAVVRVHHARVPVHNFSAIRKHDPPRHDRSRVESMMARMRDARDWPAGMPLPWFAFDRSTGEWHLHDGHHRVAAAHLAGKHDVPALFYDRAVFLDLERRYGVSRVGFIEEVLPLISRDAAENLKLGRHREVPVTGGPDYREIRADLDAPRPQTFVSAPGWKEDPDIPPYPTGVVVHLPVAPEGESPPEPLTPYLQEMNWRAVITAMVIAADMANELPLQIRARYENRPALVEQMPPSDPRWRLMWNAMQGATLLEREATERWPIDRFRRYAYDMENPARGATMPIDPDVDLQPVMDSWIPSVANAIVTADRLAHMQNFPMHGSHLRDAANAIRWLLVNTVYARHGLPPANHPDRRNLDPLLDAVMHEWWWRLHNLYRSREGYARQAVYEPQHRPSWIAGSADLPPVRPGREFQQALHNPEATVRVEGVMDAVRLRNLSLDQLQRLATEAEARRAALGEGEGPIQPIIIHVDSNSPSEPEPPRFEIPSLPVLPMPYIDELSRPWRRSQRPPRPSSESTPRRRRRKPKRH